MLTKEEQKFADIIAIHTGPFVSRLLGSDPVETKKAWKFFASLIEERDALRQTVIRQEAALARQAAEKM